jgi:glycerol-3-phosphate acyltransferase PlsY
MSALQLLIPAAYLLGSLSSAIIVCRLAGLPDPRSGGSGNPGATNVLRLGGKKLAAVTLAGDLLKGLLPLLAGHALGAPPALLGLVGLAAFLGHLYPVFFRFQGGKGVATALGVLFGLDWVVGLATAATWLAVAWLSRTSSLSALVATALAPAWVAWRLGAIEPVLACAVMTAMLFWRHQTNIRRLWAGTEPKIGQR